MQNVQNWNALRAIGVPGVSSLVAVGIDFSDTEAPEDDEDLVAYRAGKKAFLFGRSLDANPYDGGTALAEEWELGWITEAESDTRPGD